MHITLIRKYKLPSECTYVCLEYPSYTGFAKRALWGRSIFADGRAIGDTGLVENPQDGQQGWHIIYLEGWDEPVWKLTGKNALTNEKLNTWLEGLTENMEATQGAGVKYLGE